MSEATMPRRIEYSEPGSSKVFVLFDGQPRGFWRVGSAIRHAKPFQNAEMAEWMHKEGGVARVEVEGPESYGDYKAAADRTSDSEYWRAWGY